MDISAIIQTSIKKMTRENITTNQWIDCSDENYWVESDDELNSDYFTIVSMPSDTWNEKNDVTIAKDLDISLWFATTRLSEGLFLLCSKPL